MDSDAPIKRGDAMTAQRENCMRDCACVIECCISVTAVWRQRGRTSYGAYPAPTYLNANRCRQRGTCVYGTHDRNDGDAVPFTGDNLFKALPSTIFM